MKRSILVISLLFIWATFVFSQSITITSPNSRDNWDKGRAYDITWTKAGRMAANVKIRLYNSTGTTKILGISDTTPNDGSYSWAIPRSFPNGIYIVRVKTIDNRFFNNSDRFHISDSSAETSTPDDVVEAPPVVTSGAELSIEEVTRTDTNRVRIGVLLEFRVKVKNSGHTSANICVANNNSDKDRNFYDKGECGIINRNSTKDFLISIRVTRLFKSSVFLIKAGAEGLLGDVLWKDSNSVNNFKTIYFPESLADLLVTEILEVRYGHSLIQPETS